MALFPLLVRYIDCLPLCCFDSPQVPAPGRVWECRGDCPRLDQDHTASLPVGYSERFAAIIVALGRAGGQREDRPHAAVGRCWGEQTWSYNFSGITYYHCQSSPMLLVSWLTHVESGGWVLLLTTKQTNKRTQLIEWRWRGDPQSSVIRGFQAQLTNHDATDDSESFDLDTTVPQYYSHDVLMCCRNEMQKRDNNYMTWHWNVAVAQ